MNHWLQWSDLEPRVIHHSRNLREAGTALNTAPFSGLLGRQAKIFTNVLVQVISLAQLLSKALRGAVLVGKN